MKTDKQTYKREVEMNSENPAVKLGPNIWIRLCSWNNETLQTKNVLMWNTWKCNTKYYCQRNQRNLVKFMYSQKGPHNQVYFIFPQQVHFAFSPSFSRTSKCIHTLIKSLFLPQEIEVLQNFIFFAWKIACTI